jgi:hypothetical protein
MSAFGPSAGLNPTCALRLDTVYVSPSIGTTPVLEHAVVKQARKSVAVQVFFTVLFREDQLLLLDFDTLIRLGPELRALKLRVVRP